jgi:hypothetical protein
MCGNGERQENWWDQPFQEMLSWIQHSIQLSQEIPDAIRLNFINPHMEEAINGVYLYNL